MARIHTQIEGTVRQRLVEAGEHLFATRGIDAVSLAEITQAAGLNNTGAVHYYFGGREELLTAIVEGHRAHLDAQREELLDEMEALGETTGPLLVKSLVEPMVELLDDERGRAFLSIQAQRVLRPRRPPDMPRPLSLRLLRLIGDPGDRGPIATLLGDLGHLLAYSALAQRAHLEAAQGREAGVGRDEFVHQLTAAITRIVEGDDAGTAT